MKEIQILQWCDACAEESEKRTPSTKTVVLAVGASGPKTLDLCNEHEALLYAPLVALVANRGVEVERPTQQPAPERRGGLRPPGQGISGQPEQCPMCDQKRTGWAGVRKHLEGVHGVDPAEASKMVPRPAGAVDCPDCGQVIVGAVGLNSHRKMHQPAA